MVSTVTFPELELKGDKFIQPDALPSNLRLYGHRGCPYAERVRIILALKKIPYQFAMIDFLSRPPWYMNLPSAGRVPVLELPNRSYYLYESLAIAQYVDESQEGPVNLMPRGPENVVLRAQIRALMGRAENMTNYFYPTVKSFGEDKVNMESLRKDIVSFEGILSANDKGHNNPFFFDMPAPTFADVALYPHIRRLMIFEGTALCDIIFQALKMKEHPHFMKWYNAMLGIKEIADLTVQQKLFMDFLQRFKETKQFLFTL